MPSKVGKLIYGSILHKWSELLLIALTKFGEMHIEYEMELIFSNWNFAKNS